MAVAFFEVEAGEDDPAAYVARERRARCRTTSLVFTPGTAREDPCEGMRKHMEKKRAAKPAAPAAPAPEAPAVAAPAQ